MKPKERVNEGQSADRIVEMAAGYCEAVCFFPMISYWEMRFIGKQCSKICTSEHAGAAVSSAMRV